MNSRKIVTVLLLALLILPAMPTNVLAPSTQASPAVSIHTCTIHLHQGWNLISIPILDIGKASDLKSLIGSNCTAIAGWDNSLGRFITHPTETSISNFKIEPQHGYFVNVIDDTVFQVQGQAVVNINISLENGWNLLGWFDPLPTYANNLIGKISYCTHIKKWNNATQNFELYPGNNFKINYCEGFFVYLEQKSRWSYELKDTDKDRLYDIWEENGFNITKETTGETLTNISTGLTQNLNSIAWKTDGAYALMVGDNGTIAKYDEKKISTINSGTNKKLYSVEWQPQSNYALICGENIVLLYDGKEDKVTVLLEDSNVYYDIAYEPQGQYALITSNNGTWRYDGSFTQVGLTGTVCKAVAWNRLDKVPYVSTNGALYKYDGTDFQKIQTMWEGEEILSMAWHWYDHYMLMLGKYKPYDDTWPVLATYDSTYSRIQLSEGEYTYSEGTENVCLGKTVSTGGTVNSPENAVDGSGSTYANLVAYNFGSVTAWLSVNLGQNYVISHMDASIAWNNVGTPTGYMYLQANLGGGWTNIYQRGASETTWEQIHSLPIYTDQVRFYENIDGTGPSNLINIWLYEFRAFKAIPNGDLGTLKNMAWKPDFSKALIAGVNDQNKGILLKYNNTKVTTVQNTSEQLNSISWKPDSSYALIVGNNGTLIKYMDYNASYEYIYTDPNNNDTDGDGILDGEEILGWEIIVNGEPVTVYSLPAGLNKLDSDNDGISDHDERFIYYTNPSSHDTDGDGIGDYEEINNYFPYEKIEMENYIPNNKIEYSETYGYLVNTTYRVHENGTALYITNTSNYGEWLSIFLDIRGEGDYKIYVRGKTSSVMPLGSNSTLYMNINSSSFANYMYPRDFETRLLGSKHLSNETHNFSVNADGGLIIDYIYLEKKGMNATNHDSDGDGLLDGGSKNINDIEYKGENSCNCYPLSPDTDRDCVYDGFEAYNDFNPNPAEQKDKIHTVFLLPVNATHAARTMINEQFYIFMLNVNITNENDLIDQELKDPYGANLMVRGLNELIVSESIFYRAFYDNATGELDLSLINDTAIGDLEENQTKWFRSNESISATNITVIVCDTNGTKASNLMRKLLFNETNDKVAVGSIVTDEINELKLPCVLLDMTANLRTNHSVWKMFAGIAGEAWNLMTAVFDAGKEIAIKIYKIAVNITQKIANKIWEGITWLANATTKLSAEFNKRVIQPIKNRWNNFKNDVKQTVNGMLNTTCKDLKTQLRTYLPLREGVFNTFQKFVDNPDSSTASGFVTAMTSIVRIGVPFMQLTGVLSSIQALVLCGVMSQDEAEDMVNETAQCVYSENYAGGAKTKDIKVTNDTDNDCIPDDLTIWDDFNDGNDNGWTKINGAWNVVNSEYNQSEINASMDPVNDTEAISYTGNKTWENIVVEGNVSIVEGSGADDYAGFAFRYQNINNYYAVGIDETGYVNLWWKNNGVWKNISYREAPISFSYGEWYTIKIIAMGLSIQVYVNDILKINVKFLGNESILESGTIACWIVGCHALFDNIKISDPDDDNDGLSDIWETNNGTNPKKPDLFLEIDWLEGYKPLTPEQWEENRKQFSWLLALPTGGVFLSPLMYLIYYHFVTPLVFDLFEYYSIAKIKDYFAAKGVTVHLWYDETSELNATDLSAIGVDASDGTSDYETDIIEDNYHNKNTTHVYLLFVNYVEGSSPTVINPPKLGHAGDSSGAVIFTDHVKHFGNREGSGVLGLGLMDSKNDLAVDVMTHEVGHCIGMYDWQYHFPEKRLNRPPQDFMENTNKYDADHFSDVSWLGVWTKTYEDFAYKEQYTKEQYGDISYIGIALWDKGSVDEGI